MTIVYKDSNSISKIKEILSNEKPTSVLLITGNKSYETSGAKKMVESQLSSFNITHISGFSMYPSAEDLKKTIDTIKENKIDFVIGIGGGTVMDLGKAASILNDEKNLLEDYITGKQKPQGNNIKRLLIPTNAGTGAEITPYSSIYIGKAKYSLAHPSMLPDYAILSPELTYNLPPRITARTGYDALAQAIESFWSVRATEESKEYSREAIKLVLDNLIDAVKEPNQDNKAAMLWAAHLAGKAIAIAKTTAAHALSHLFMTYYKISHGHAVLLSLPHFFPMLDNVSSENIHQDLTIEYVEETFKELLSLLKVKNGEEAKDMLLKLADEIGLEKKLSDFGVTDEYFNEIIDSISTNPKVANNPIKITGDMYLDILKNLI